MRKKQYRSVDNYLFSEWELEWGGKPPNHRVNKQLVGAVALLKLSISDIDGNGRIEIVK